MEKITFNYEDKILDVDVIYRKRKNISIKITPKDRIQIIAPHKVPIKILKETIEKNSRWILSKLDKFKNIDDSFLKRDYVDGEIYYYIGKPHYLNIIKDKNMQNEKNYNYISVKEDCIEIRTNNWEKEYLKECLKKWYKLKSEEIVMDRLAYLREQSDYFRKIEPNLIKIKEQKKIWGSCNSNKNIYINSKISMLPVEAIDYIIAHEFCHILYMNHSKDFYASVEKIIPNYKEINLWLKKNSYKFTL
ncbi:M48 family metallopeptidase [Intestinibacter sp.]|uniref:M48 family metallopeptidase n=1 Tax=Intestinibacter sp. TaxID=1965304 RepID=UPI003F190494